MKKKETLYPMTPALLEGECFERAGDIPIYVRLGTPAPDALPGGDFYCPIEVRTHLTGEVLLCDQAFGINSSQAVENAFQRIRQNWPTHMDEKTK